MLEEIKKEKLELIVRKHLPPAFIGWGSKGFMCQVHYPELCKIIEDYESTVIEQKLIEAIKQAKVEENERFKTNFVKAIESAQDHGNILFNELIQSLVQDG